MIENEIGLTDAGLEMPRQADYLTIISERYNAHLASQGFTEVPDYDQDEYFGQTREIVAFLLGQLSDIVQEIYDTRVPGNATGLGLANLALIVGVQRLQPTKSTATVTLGGTVGTVIVEGKIASGGLSDPLARWVLTEDVTIGSGGTIDVVVRNEVTGPVTADPGDINTRVTPVDGWATVTNAATASPGRDSETDGALRVRRQRALQGQGSSNVNATLSALLELDFVTGAVVIENDTITAQTIDGILMDPVSIAAVVGPSVLTTAQEETVARAIFDTLPSATATVGADSATVTKLDTRSKTIKWDTTTDVTVDVAYTLVLASGFDIAEVSAALELLVNDFFLTLIPGETVYPSPVEALALFVDGVLNVDSLLLNGGAAAVTHDAFEQPVIGTYAAT